MSREGIEFVLPAFLVLPPLPSSSRPRGCREREFCHPQLGFCYSNACGDRYESIQLQRTLTPPRIANCTTPSSHGPPTLHLTNNINGYLRNDLDGSGFVGFNFGPGEQNVCYYSSDIIYQPTGSRGIPLSSGSNGRSSIGHRGAAIVAFCVGVVGGHVIHL